MSLEMIKSYLFFDLSESYDPAQLPPGELGKITCKQDNYPARHMLVVETPISAGGIPRPACLDKERKVMSQQNDAL